MNREDLWKVYSNCCLLSCDLSTFKRGLFVSNRTKCYSPAAKQRKHPGNSTNFCTNSHVLFEPLAQGGSSPIQGRWKRHNLEFFTHTEGKKVSSSSPKVFCCITFSYCRILIEGLSAGWNSVCLTCQPLY